MSPGHPRKTCRFPAFEWDEAPSNAINKERVLASFSSFLSLAEDGSTHTQKTPLRSFLAAFTQADGPVVPVCACIHSYVNTHTHTHTHTHLYIYIFWSIIRIILLRTANANSSSWLAFMHASFAGRQTRPPLAWCCVRDRSTRG